MISVLGLYGGQLSLSSQGTGSDLYYAGYHCTEYGPSASSMKEYDSLDISSLSYDPRTAQVLIEVAGEENGYLTVLKGPLCGGFHECRFVYVLQLALSRDGILAQMIDSTK